MRSAAVDGSADPYVYRFVLVRDGRPPTTGTELSLLQLPAERVAALGHLELERAIDAERRRWAAAARSQGYRDGWSVVVERSRGYRRALWPVPAAPVGGLVQ